MTDRADELDWQRGRITDWGIEAMRADVGVARPARAWSRHVDSEAIWQFARGVGDDNPLWWNPAYAAGTMAGRQYAYPTFLYRWGSGPRTLGDRDDIRAIERYLPGVLGLWASDHWHWHGRVFAGETIDATTQLADVSVRAGSFSGRTVAQTERISYRTEAGVLVAELDRTIIRLEREQARERRRYLDIPMARYTAADREAFAHQYAGEATARRGARPRYWEDVQPGDPLVTLLKGPLTVASLVGWLLGAGAALTPTSRLMYRELTENPSVRLLDEETGIEDTIEAAHWDPYFARASGLPRGYDFGSQRISWLTHVLLDWGGDEAFLRDLRVRLRRPNLMGDVTWLTGTVTGKDRTAANEATVTCELTATNQRQEITASATAVVVLPVRLSG
jgi:acyl dehydratase